MTASPPVITPFLLRQCKSLLQAHLVHQQAITQGIIRTIPNFPSHLISTYLALDAPTHYPLTLLLHSLSRAPATLFCWNALIRRAVSLGLLEDSLSFFRRLRLLGWSPDHYTFPLVLKACGEIRSMRHGGSVHAVVCSSGFESNVFVCNSLVTMYARCGAVGYARKMFDEMREREVIDLVSWNSIVAAYVQSGDSKCALSLFGNMCEGGDIDVKPDAVSLVSVLSACASSGGCWHGEQVHGFALRSGLFEDVWVANALVDMYAKSKMMDAANKVFNRIKHKDVVSWNAMVTGYSQIGMFEDALGLVEKMEEENIELDVVSWSAIIAGYAQKGLGHEALDVFRQMQVSRSSPNEVTLVSIVSGCASIGALLHGKEIHCYAIKHMLNLGRSDHDLMVINAMIDMYAKCRSIDVARAMFDSLASEDKDVVTWTAMIGGYAQHGEANDALELFSSMVKREKLVKPNPFTISCALMACARLAAVRFGKQIHAYALRSNYDMHFVANCLIDTYSKCGDMDAARIVFDNMEQKNSVSWTSVMTGYGMHGCGEEALEMFDEMRRVGLPVDGITFLVVLYACSHSGFVDQGIKYFHNMEKEFGVTPVAEHYACIVDLLGRAGRFDEAMNLIRRMPMEPSPIVWMALLSGCRIHGNVELGEYAANRLSELESVNDGSYTLLSNIYANARRWKDVVRIRTLMKGTGITKRPGCSWVQGKKGSATFYVGDRTHPQSKHIYDVLADLIKRIKVLGYVPETSFALHDVDDEEKGDLLSEHSEKLALAYGIITSAPGVPIRITKNLRVCGDCHSAIAYISMLIEHEIILRDSSRFHHFKNGSCSCKGYW